MLSISPAPAALAKRASSAFSSARLMFSCLRPRFGLGLSALIPPLLYAMCARLTVLSDTPKACAICGCVSPLSRNSTIWMRSRWADGMFFHPSAVFSRRSSALLHLTICWAPESDGASESRRRPRQHPPAALRPSIQAVLEVVLDFVGSVGGADL